MCSTIELLVEEEDERVRLCSPEVGFFACALPQGALVGSNAAAGVLHALGRRWRLVVPASISGRVVSAPPELVLQPVGYGTVLYEIAPLEKTPRRAHEDAESARSSGTLVFRAPYSGRFWQRPGPHDPPFVKAGDFVAVGQTIGLIEVMKTFTHLSYQAGRGLPARARIVRICVADGAEVGDETPLLELSEP
jgi:biotin carboxyl carrier protein